METMAEEVKNQADGTFCCDRVATWRGAISSSGLDAVCKVP
jgi:hypothetical protein